MNYLFHICGKYTAEVYNFFKNIIKNDRRKVYFFMLLLAFSIIIPIGMNTKYCLSLIFSLFLFFSILSFLILKKKKILFEPVYLFSLYYLTVCFSIWYLVFTDFSTNIFIQNTTFQGDFTTLFTISTLYYFIGYIMTLLGSSFIKVDQDVKFKLTSEDKISDTSLNLVMITFGLIGILNFAYNVYYFADGNLFTYLVNISNRSREFINGGTTLGYVFAETALYVYLFKILRSGKLFNIKFILYLIVFFVIKASVGRIFQTVVTLGCVIGVYYFITLWKNKRVDNKKLISIGLFLLVIGIILYYLRLASNLSYIGKMDDGILSSFKNFIQNIGYYAVDRGNMPNVALMPKIIDAWNTDIGFLFGSSFFIFLFSLLPSNMNLITAPSILIKQTWFSHIQGGNLPPTGIGEMYANFGVFGIIFGMMIFGILISFLYKFMLKYKSYWLLVIYMQITIGFIALYPKGEFSNLSLWMILPIMMTYILLRLITIIFSKLRNFITGSGF